MHHHTGTRLYSMTLREINDEKLTEPWMTFQFNETNALSPHSFHYRMRGGAAIDLVLQTKEKLVGIECLTSIDISPYRQRE